MSINAIIFLVDFILITIIVVGTLILFHINMKKYDKLFRFRVVGIGFSNGEYYYIIDDNGHRIRIVVDDTEKYGIGDYVPATCLKDLLSKKYF